VAGRLLRGVDGLIYLECSTGVAAEHFEDASQAPTGTGVVDQPGGHDCTSIDHRVAGPPGFGLQADGIEGFAGGLDVDLLHHLLHALVLEGDAVGERLGYGLDGERVAGLSRLVDVAVHGDHRDTEAVRVDFGQFRDVVRDCTLAQCLKLLVELVEVVLERGDLHRYRVLLLVSDGMRARSSTPAFWMPSQVESLAIIKPPPSSRRPEPRRRPGR